MAAMPAATASSKAGASHGNPVEVHAEHLDRVPGGLRGQDTNAVHAGDAWQHSGRQVGCLHHLPQFGVVAGRHEGDVGKHLSGQCGHQSEVMCVHHVRTKAAANVDEQLPPQVQILDNLSVCHLREPVLG